MSEIGTKIGALLREKGLTQLALAEHLGVPPNTVNRWVRQGVTPRARLIPQIAEFLGESVDYLLGTLESTDWKTEAYQTWLAGKVALLEASIRYLEALGYAVETDSETITLVESRLQRLTLTPEEFEVMIDGMKGRTDAEIRQFSTYKRLNTNCPSKEGDR